MWWIFFFNILGLNWPIFCSTSVTIAMSKPAGVDPITHNHGQHRQRLRQYWTNRKLDPTNPKHHWPTCASEVNHHKEHHRKAFLLPSEPRLLMQPSRQNVEPARKIVIASRNCPYLNSPTIWTKEEETSVTRRKRSAAITKKTTTYY